MHLVFKGALQMSKFTLLYFIVILLRLGLVEFSRVMVSMVMVRVRVRFSFSDTVGTGLPDMD